MCTDVVDTNAEIHEMFRCIISMINQITLKLTGKS